jgi:hypothetical protein
VTVETLLVDFAIRKGDHAFRLQPTQTKDDPSLKLRFEPERLIGMPTSEVTVVR